MFGLHGLLVEVWGQLHWHWPSLTSGGQLWLGGTKMVVIQAEEAAPAEI